MTDYAWPDDLAPYAVSFYLQPHTGGSESPFSRVSKVYSLSAPRWICRMSLRAPDSADRWSGDQETWGECLDAFLAQLQGRANRVLVHDFRRPGTARAFTNAAIAAGATTVTLTGGAVGEIRVGEYIGGDGRPHIVTALQVSGANMIATVAPPFGAAVASGAATYQEVTGQFRLISDDAGENASEVGQLATYQLEFVEDYTPPLPFDPATLFSGGADGAWYDPSDLASMFQDSAGTTAVTASGQPVGRINDKSGNGFHLLQATSSKRPTYQTAGGLHWLDFDGVDDCMQTAVFAPTWTQPNHIAIAAKFDTLPSGMGIDTFIIDGFGGSGRNGVYGTSPGNVHGLFAGAAYSSGLSVTTNAAVITGRFDGASSQSRVNGVAGSTSNAGTQACDGITLGSRFSLDSLFFDGRVYGLVARDAAFTDTERGEVETYLAGKSGVTL